MAFEHGAICTMFLLQQRINEAHGYAGVIATGIFYLRFFERKCVRTAIEHTLYFGFCFVGHLVCEGVAGDFTVLIRKYQFVRYRIERGAYYYNTGKCYLYRGHLGETTDGEKG